MPRTTTHRRPRRVAAALLALVAAVAMTTAACSDDGDTKADGGDKSTTTATDGSVDEATTTTLSDKEFNAQVAALQDELDANKGDLCKLVQVSASFPGNPTNKEQTKAAIDFTTGWLDAIAEAAPADKSAEADQLTSTATALRDAAEKADYSAAFIDSEEAAKLTGPEVQQALQTLITPCIPNTSGAAPSTTTGGPTG